MRKIPRQVQCTNFLLEENSLVASCIQAGICKTHTVSAIHSVLPDVRIYPYKYGFLTQCWINVRNFKKYGFFPVFVWIFHFFINFHYFFFGNFLWFLRTSQFYSEWKVCGAIMSFSMITKCWSDHRSDHNLLEWECGFTLGLNAATNTDYIKKCFEQKLFRIKFSRKKFPVRISQSLPEVELWGSQDCHFWNRK